MALVKNQDGRLEFIAVSDAGSAWSVAQAAAGSWDALNVHSLEGTDLRQVTATSYRDGRLALVALGGDGRAYWRAQIAPNSGWGPWSGLEGENLRAVAAGANADGRLEVHAVGGDNQLWNRHEVPGGRWSGWGYLAPGSFTAVSALLRNQDGRLEAFAASSTARTAGHIWQTAPNGGWRDAVDTLPFGAPTDDLAVTALADGRLVAASADFGACTVVVMAQEVPNRRFVNLQRLGRACLPPPPSVKVNWLTANPDHLPAGSATTLEWSLGANESCNPFDVKLLRQVYGMPDSMVTITAPSTTTTVITASTTFRLTASCPGTNVSDFKTVFVTESPPPPTPQAVVVFLDGPFKNPEYPKQNVAFKAWAVVVNAGTKSSDPLTVKFFVDGTEQSHATLLALAPGEQRDSMFDVPALTGLLHDLEWRIVENGQSLFGEISVWP
jgi:hypothetical protein